VFELGAREVWLLFPGRKQVYRLKAPLEIEILNENDLLTGGELLPKCAWASCLSEHRVGRDSSPAARNDKSTTAKKPVTPSRSEGAQSCLDSDTSPAARNEKCWLEPNSLSPRAQRGVSATVRWRFLAWLGMTGVFRVIRLLSPVWHPEPRARNLWKARMQFGQVAAWVRECPTSARVGLFECVSDFRLDPTRQIGCHPAPHR